MNNASNAGTSGTAAAVDQAVFTALESLLADYLDADGNNVDLQVLSRLVSGNPIERGPLAALGSDPSEADLTQRLDVLRRCYTALKRHKDELRIAASLLPETFELYIPIARFMAARSRAIRSTDQRAAVFGINGGQGSGKTTINAFLQIILSEGLGVKTAGLSIDDVYKTYDERQQMARSVHPLFAIRSVAGTHDTELAIEKLTQLMHASPGTQTLLPRFDKMARGGQGDRLPASDWTPIEGPVDVIIFEGWFVGARPQAAGALRSPINRREADDDPDGTWRSTVNHLLATDYQTLFDLLDDLLVIQVRSMQDVYQNRELQEQHLRRKLEDTRRAGTDEDTGELGAMSPDEVVAFIALYERTTRHMLETLPNEARVTLFIGDDHRVERLRVNAPSTDLRGHSLGSRTPGPSQ